MSLYWGKVEYNYLTTYLELYYRIIPASIGEGNTSVYGTHSVLNPTPPSSTRGKAGRNHLNEENYHAPPQLG
jgi:hypothetical protein